MRFLLSHKLPLKEGIVYSYGHYRQQREHAVTPLDISDTFNITIATCQKLLTSLHNKQLVTLTEDQLRFADPTSQHFRMSSKGYPFYFTMSLNIIGSANETAIYWSLRDRWEQGLTGQTGKGLASSLHIHRRNFDRTLRRLEDKGLIFIKRNKGGFTILDMPASKPIRKPVKARVTLEDIGDGLPIQRKPKPEPQPEQAKDNKVYTWKDIAPESQEDSPNEIVLTQILGSGMSIDLVRKYWKMYNDEWDGMPFEYLPSETLQRLISEARSEHWKNKGNSQFGKLLEYKINNFIEEHRK